MIYGNGPTWDGGHSVTSKKWYTKKKNYGDVGRGGEREAEGFVEKKFIFIINVILPE